MASADPPMTSSRFARSAPIAVRLALAFGLLLGLLAGVAALALKQLERVGESSRVVAESRLHPVLVAVKSAQANATISSNHMQEEQSRRYVLDLTALAVLVALFGAVMITRSITRPLAQTVALAREIADGKLDSPMPAAGRDEVGRL